MDPGFNAAFIVDAIQIKTIMVKDAQNPFTANLTVVAIGQNGRVLEGNGNLVIKPIGHPTALLRRIEFAFSHHHMKRMVDVVAGAFAAQQSFKFFCAPRGAGISERFVHCVVHRVISMPSNATSMPCAVKIWRCGLLSSKIGLVLLMWIKIFLT